MTVPEQPFRQVHLDFHTSEHIDEVAADFDPDAFAQTLARARVASVNCFARGWHGWMYYPSRHYPEAVHPGLVRRDLLEAQIRACHAHGIRVPIYVAVQVDARMSRLHPEWTQVGPDGRQGRQRPFEPGWGAPLCLNTPFRDFLLGHVQELLSTLEVDGFWFDGVSPQNCCCPHCLAEMEGQGIDPEDVPSRRRFGLEVCDRFQREVTARIHRSWPEATVFYNAGHIGPRHRLSAGSFTHFEIESLPSGGWGYLHFPTAMRLARTMGREVVGMTGKFHTSWGDFHSFKNSAALEFECFQMLAHGAKCSIGDQLHPRGRLCEHTYELIGSVYRQVAAVEPWCRGAVPATEIALISCENLVQKKWDELLPDPVLGAVRMLQEEALQFDILDLASGPPDLSGYRLAVLPDQIVVDEPLAERLDDFLAGGGAVLSSHRAGLDPSGRRFALDAWGIAPEGETPFAQDFVVPAPDFEAGLPRTEHVMYLRGIDLAAGPDARILATRRHPYFDRTWRSFCSHKHAPSDGRDAGPAVVQIGRVIHFAHPVFRIYREFAPRWVRSLVAAAADRLLGSRLLRHDGPRTLLATILDQPRERRKVIHLLHYVPERRGRDLDIIEDAMPVPELRLTLSCPSCAASAALVPQGDELPCRRSGDEIQITVPPFVGRQIVAIHGAA